VYCMYVCVVWFSICVCLLCPSMRLYALSETATATEACK